MFDDHKKDVLAKLYGPDLSRKGSVDEYLVPFIEAINAHPDYVTTSSCSGRVMLYVPAGKKYDAQWLYVNHDVTTNYDAIAPLLEKLPEGEVYLKCEGFILHVACRDFEAAKKFMIFAQQHGYKNSSILAASKKFIVQIIGSERFDTLIAKDAKLLVDETYLRILIEKGNELLEEVHQGIDRLQRAFIETQMS